MNINAPVLTANLLFLIFFLGSCKESRREAIAVIVNTKMLDSIPSGSGLERDNDSLFIVGDDAGSIYKLSERDFGYHRIPLNPAQPGLYRMQKETKTDYESTAKINYHGGEYLLVFGSGSKSPERDSLVIVDISLNRIDTTISIKPFYAHLMEVSKTTKESFNIEGATIVKDRLILLNRGNNFLYSFNAEQFIEYVLTRGSLPQVKYVRAVLPTLDKYEARLSGAATSGDDLIFCASVEQTTDWTKDGPISGSFIGLMDPATAQTTLAGKLMYQNGKTAPEKIESVVLLRKEADKSFVILALADNDDGKTKVIEIHLSEKHD